MTASFRKIRVVGVASFALALAMAGCLVIDPKDYPAADQGAEGGMCYRQGTCDPGLECVDGRCVPEEGGSGAGAGLGGVSGSAGASGNAGRGGVSGSGGSVGSGGVSGSSGAFGDGGASGSGGVFGNGGVSGSGGAFGTSGVSGSGGASGSGSVIAWGRCQTSAECADGRVCFKAFSNGSGQCTRSCMYPDASGCDPAFIPSTPSVCGSQNECLMSCQTQAACPVGFACIASYCLYPD